MPEKPKQAEERVSPFPQMEEEIAAYWKKYRIFERSIEERPESKTYSFYDGPPYATGLPHYGHLLQSIIKDAVPRYWTMKGYRVPRVWGWDCHGLPIENLIEKELKLGSKRDIEAYGIDKFNEACRSAVFTYEKDWAKYIERIGRWVDFDNSYKTLTTDYIESVWWVFSELYKKDFVYKGTRVSLFCPRCSTSLSNQEVTMGNSYVEHTDPAVTIKFPVVGKDKTFFLAWTTTPWTLPANTALTVHPDLMYVAAHIEETDETLIFAEARQSEVLKQYYPLKSGGVEFEVTGHWKGSELVGMRYEPLYSFLPVQGDGFRVVSGEHVSANDGTGIVHTAPAYGEEDFDMMKRHELPMLQTVDDEGRFIVEVTPFAGQKIRDANPLVLKDLEARSLLYREEKLVHNLPVCWRCSTLLLYKAQPAWFINITKLKSNLFKTAAKTNWHPEHFKEGRFGKGLETAPDWNFSRTRYWGSPIPVWEGVKTGERIIVSSIEELKRRAKPGTLPEKLDLHRPYIDDVVLLTDSGEEARRIPEVFDVWFDSGAMPFASVHYPFENRKSFETNFPADFIGEAQDQTRGWFYSLHVLSTAIMKKPAFTNVVVTGLVLAEDGKKMSKRLKNYPDPWKVLTTYGADALRYYLLSSPVVEADSLNFSERDLQNIVRAVINLLSNVKTFYLTYATDHEVKIGKPRSAHVLDRWLYARFNELLGQVTEHMDNYELGRATRPIRDFVDDLSTWWLRRSRDRMKSENQFESLDALKTLREILLETAKLSAPFMPFIADKTYRDLNGVKASVHLEKWSKTDPRLHDERLLADMRWIREVASKVHEQRSAAKIAVRQALSKITIKFKDTDEAHRLSRQNDLLGLLRDEVNVETVAVETDGALENPYTVELDTVITPELRLKGLRRELVRQVMSLRKAAKLNPGDLAAVYIDMLDGEQKDAWMKDGALLRELGGRVEFIKIPEEVEHSEELKLDSGVCKVGLVRVQQSEASRVS